MWCLLLWISLWFCVVVLWLGICLVRLVGGLLVLAEGSTPVSGFDFNLGVGCCTELRYL